MNEQINPYGSDNRPDYIREEESRDGLSDLLYRWKVGTGMIGTIWESDCKKSFLEELKDNLKCNVTLIDHKKQLKANGFISLDWKRVLEPAVIHCCNNKSYAIRPYNIHLSLDSNDEALIAITNWLPEKLEFEPLLYGTSKKSRVDGKERLILTQDTFNPLYVFAYTSKMKMPKVSRELERRIDRGAMSLLRVK